MTSPRPRARRDQERGDIKGPIEQIGRPTDWAGANAHWQANLKTEDGRH